MGTEDLIYAAGLFDGEGSVNLSRGKGRFRTVRISVASTCEELTGFMLRFGGRIYQVPHRDNRKPQTEWILVGRAAIEVLRKIRPYMRETRKIGRTDIAIHRILPLMQQRSEGVPLSDADAEKRFQAEIDMQTI